MRRSECQLVSEKPAWPEGLDCIRRGQALHLETASYGGMAFDAALQNLLCALTLEVHVMRLASAAGPAHLKPVHAYSVMLATSGICAEVQLSIGSSAILDRCLVANFWSWWAVPMSVPHKPPYLHF